MIIRACILLHNFAIQSKQVLNEDEIINEDDMNFDNGGDEEIGIDTRGRLISQLVL